MYPSIHPSTNRFIQTERNLVAIKNKPYDSSPPVRVVRLNAVKGPGIYHHRASCPVGISDELCFQQFMAISQHLLYSSSNSASKIRMIDSYMSHLIEDSVDCIALSMPSSIIIHAALLCIHHTVPSSITHAALLCIHHTVQ